MSKSYSKSNPHPETGTTRVIDQRGTYVKQVRKADGSWWNVRILSPGEVRQQQEREGR